jgi:hypothetical protein
MHCTNANDPTNGSTPTLCNAGGHPGIGIFPTTLSRRATPLSSLQSEIYEEAEQRWEINRWMEWTLYIKKNASALSAEERFEMNPLQTEDGSANAGNLFLKVFMSVRE